MVKTALGGPRGRARLSREEPGGRCPQPTLPQTPLIAQDGPGGRGSPLDSRRPFPGQLLPASRARGQGPHVPPELSPEDTPPRCLR